MPEKTSRLGGKHILAVDDEKDVLDTIAEALEEAYVDKAQDYNTAMDKLDENNYDLAILDIMGVDGLKLLEKAVDRNIPAVMLTAHALSADTLLESIRRGAISYLPKEKLAELEEILDELLGAMESGEPTWKLLFDRLEEFFNDKFGSDWKDKDRKFWSEFSRTYQVSKEVQSRLKHGRRVGLNV
ncbi:MAG: response regulator [Thermodesulfobacteriota bacterium]